ncbi:MAG: hypothetical protein GY796_09255 [Chloroflexi bacterium]|nr:hypothetical protein [Chloroflexota bacterium]
MKKLTVGLLITLVTLSILSVTAFAAPTKQNAETGPFEGVFTGTVTGDNNSKTTLTLDLNDEDNLVAGTASLGGGLLVDAGGFCGSAVLPASSMWAEGGKTAAHPDELAAEATIDVGGFEVTVEVTGELSDDGDTLDVEAKIDTPWMCGRDPVIMGTLTKVS